VNNQLPWVNEQLVPQTERLEFAPLPWQTHPIDTVHEQEGWGPFFGPYTPWNFPDPATFMAGCGIDDTWLQGNNRAVVSYSPPYDITTLQVDNSTSWVNNALKRLNPSDDSSSRLYNSTISNTSNPNPVGTATPNTFMGRMRALLGGS
jgi:hypothetical protein